MSMDLVILKSDHIYLDRDTGRGTSTLSSIKTTDIGDQWIIYWRYISSHSILFSLTITVHSWLYKFECFTLNTLQSNAILIIDNLMTAKQTWNLWLAKIANILNVSLVKTLAILFIRFRIKIVFQLFWNIWITLMNNGTPSRLWCNIALHAILRLVTLCSLNFPWRELDDRFVRILFLCFYDRWDMVCHWWTLSIKENNVSCLRSVIAISYTRQNTMLWKPSANKSTYGVSKTP